MVYKHNFFKIKQNIFYYFQIILFQFQNIKIHRLHQSY